MPELGRTPVASSDAGRQTTRLGGAWVPAVLVVAIVAIFALCMALAPRHSAEGEAFGGTDSAVTDTLQEHGVKPWFHPVFEPGSGEVESGLFALQAALGAGLFGYVMGNLRGRRLGREQAFAGSSPRQVADDAGQDSTSTPLTTGGEAAKNTDVHRDAADLG